MKTRRKVVVGNANNMIWFTHCVDHDFTMGFATKADAMRYKPYPDAWCRKCRAEKEGK